MHKQKNEIRPRKLPTIRWKKFNPEDYQPQPPPDMDGFQGICVTIDEQKFFDFLNNKEAEK